ncbi:hypothetical protein QR680_015675 [Steinernema hermaphroditum]|uniref:G-protein coupled receptors family 1 profile domain-containing protein n=1 Tax=Steinernema hermaphroditum TaxID=289476 RepID=A0AA39HB73_9BILA|nr:hypothetical protein QR680_015675 [Steinernema hermaphroditum]
MHDFMTTSIFIYIIGVFGIFGNINILIAIYRLKPRLKSSILVGLLAFSDFFCIVSELQNATRTLLDVQSYRRECFWAISTYLFMTEVQSFLMAALAFDRLFAFAFPFRYVAIRTSTYIICCCIPALIVATSFLIVGAVYINDEPIVACNPPLAYVPSVTAVWGYIGIITDLCTLSFSAIALAILLLKMSKLRHEFHSSSEYHALQTQKKLSTSCCVMILVFLLTTFATHVVLTISERLDIGADTAAVIQTNAVIFMMISYSQSYYVYFFCSKLYREAFKKQLMFLLPKRIRNVLWKQQGLLVGLLAFADVFCIVSELQNAIRTIFHVQSYRRECFWAISPYLVMTEVQSCLMSALAFDRLFAFAFPIKYVTIHTPKYVFCCCLPAMVTSVSFLIVGAFNLDDEPLVACNPPLAYAGPVSKIWGYVGVGIDMCTLTFYVTALIILLIKLLNSRRALHSEYQILDKQKKLSTSCSVMILVFLFSTFTSNVVIYLSRQLNISEGMSEKLETYMVILMMISYSQSYYVYFACSKLYRETFKKQLLCIFPERLGRFLGHARSIVVSVTPSRY